MLCEAAQIRGALVDIRGGGANTAFVETETPWVDVMCVMCFMADWTEIQPGTSTQFTLQGVLIDPERNELAGPPPWLFEGNATFPGIVKEGGTGRMTQIIRLQFEPHLWGLYEFDLRLSGQSQVTLALDVKPLGDLGK
jgi:hypothetical protein